MANGKHFLSEYLVGLGFDVNTEGLKKFFGAFDKGVSQAKIANRLLESSVGQSITTFIGYGAQVSKTFLGLVSDVADFDKQMELSARKAWMSKDAYMAMSEAVSALGYSIDDIGEIALDPELSKQFREIYGLAQNLQFEYSGLSDSLAIMREFQFQFKKLHLVANYFLNMLGAGLIKYFAEPLGMANMTLGDIINKLAKNLPMYVDMAVKKIGPFIKSLILASVNLVQRARDLYGYFKENPEQLKKILVVIASIYAIFNRTQAIAAAAFGLLLKFINQMNGESNDLNSSWESIDRFIDAAANLAKTLYDWIIKIIQKLDEWGVIDYLTDILNLLQAIFSGDFSKIKPKTNEKIQAGLESYQSGDMSDQFIGDVSKIVKTTDIAGNIIEQYKPSDKAEGIADVWKNTKAYLSGLFNKTNEFINRTSQNEIDYNTFAALSGVNSNKQTATQSSNVVTANSVYNNNNSRNQFAPVINVDARSKTSGEEIASAVNEALNVTYSSMSWG